MALTPHERETIVQLRLAGKSYSEIQRVTQRGVATIGRVCAAAGIPPSEPGARPRRPAVTPGAAPIDPAIALYRAEKAKRQRSA